MIESVACVRRGEMNKGSATSMTPILGPTTEYHPQRSDASSHPLLHVTLIWCHAAVKLKAFHPLQLTFCLQVCRGDTDVLRHRIEATSDTARLLGRLQALLRPIICVYVYCCR